MCEPNRLRGEGAGGRPRGENGGAIATRIRSGHDEADIENHRRPSERPTDREQGAIDSIGVKTRLHLKSGKRAIPSVLYKCDDRLYLTKRGGGAEEATLSLHCVYCTLRIVQIRQTQSNSIMFADDTLGGGGR